MPTRLMGKFHISGVPICDADGKLVGIITNRDLKFMSSFDVPIGEVMTKEHLITAPQGITLEEAQGPAAAQQGGKAAHRG